MKKPKISLDKDKLQQFFLLHIEKFLLGIVIGLMLLLIWSGYRLPTLSKDMTPQALVGKSDSAKQYIDTPRWNEVVGPVRIIQAPLTIVEGVLKVQQPSDPIDYMLVNSWVRPDFPKLSPRQDPILFPPEHLIVRPVIGALASYPVLRPGEEYKDPLYPQLSDDDLKKMKEKVKREQKKAQANLGGETPGGEGAMPGGGRPKRGRTAKGGEGAGGEYAGGRGTPRPGVSSPGSMPGGEGGYGSMGMAGDKFPESMQIGFPVQNMDQTIALELASITIMAVVPIQRQAEEYDKKLSNSLDYDPTRDYPSYLDFRVQRADVTDLDPSAKIDGTRWKNLDRPDVVLKEIYGDERTPGLYAGIPTEVVDPNYLTAPEQLTHPAPPYLQRDLWDLLTHPDVPLASVTLGEVAGELVPGATAPKTDDDAPVAPMMGPGGRPSMAGGGMSGEGGYGGMGGMRPGMGGAMGGMRPGMGAMPGGGEGGYGGGMRGGMGGGMPRPMGGGYGSGAYGGGEGGGYGSGVPVYTPPKHQLIRFTDTKVEPGKKYRYRIMVRVNDPNHPRQDYQPPSAASLHEEVRKRVQEQDKADSARPKDQFTGLPHKTYWRVTDWSEPSPIASVPRPERIFAGKVLPTRTQPIKGIPVASAEPTVDAFAVVFDRAKIADIPSENDKIGRGSVLNFVQKAAKVIHPVTKEVIEIPEYNVTTNALVADLMGGDPIRAISAGTSAPLTALGEMLVVDADGKLHVRNEAQDIENIRRYTVPKPDTKAKKPAEDSASGLSGEGPTPPRGRGGRSACF